MEKISLDHVSWSVDQHKNSILNDIHVTFEPNSFYGILGPNGAGKTSLVRLLLGLQQPTQGKVFYGEKPLTSFSRQELARQIAFVPQGFVRNMEFSVYDVVAMGREPHRKAFQALHVYDHELIQEALQLVGCEHLMKRSISKLSGGEMQRVMIARAIAQDTDWLILDEPISNLDIKHQYELMATLQTLHEQKGKSIIAILHDINVASQFCKDILWMKNGTVFDIKNVEEAFTAEQLNTVYDMNFQRIEKETKVYYMPKI